MHKSASTIGKRDHAFEIVVAVDPAPHDPQGQIDLGAPVFDELTCGGIDSRIGRFTGGHSKCKSNKTEANDPKKRCRKIFR